MALPLYTSDEIYEGLATEAARFGLTGFDPQREEVDDTEEDDEIATTVLPGDGPTEREARRDRETFAALLRKLNIGDGYAAARLHPSPSRGRSGHDRDPRHHGC